MQVGRPMWAAPALVFIAFLYGSMDVGFKKLFLLPEPPTAVSTCLVKTALGTLFFVPVMARAATAAESQEQAWPAALSLAILNVTSGAAIYAGIARTDAARAAFLLQTSVVITPIIEQVALRKAQPRVIWLGATIALFGVALLSSSDQVRRTGAKSSALAGDALVVLGAVLWGYYLVLTGALPPSLSAGRVQALKYVYSLGLYAAWALASQGPIFAGWTSRTAWLITIYGAWIPGAAADVLQQRAQAHVRAAEASLLLASEPVWALVLAKPLLGERFGAAEAAGGALVFLSTFLASGVLQPGGAPKHPAPPVVDVGKDLLLPSDERGVDVRLTMIQPSAAASAVA